MFIIRSIIRGMRWWSLCSVEPVVTYGLKRSRWANIPQELLREVLAGIEASESFWHARRSVVACAGVCCTWRLITNGIVNTLQVSSKITFPISVKQFVINFDMHGLRDNPLQCFVKRNRSTQTYYLFLSLTDALSDDGKFLLAARKCRRVTCTAFIISLDADDMSKGSNTLCWETETMQYLHSACNATSRSPRRMKCVMVPIFRSKSNRIENSVSRSPGSDEVLVLKSKPPRWFEQFQRWCLYFKGRVTVASINNFQLVASPENGPSGEENEKIILQFGRVGKDLFTMDYQYPISALLAFAICLGSFETKLP